MFEGVFDKRLGLAISGEKPSSELRRQIVDWCKFEFETYNVDLIQSAYLKACYTRSAVIKKRKQGLKARFTYLSKNNATQYFVVNRLGKGTIYSKLLGEFDWAEQYEGRGSTAIVTHANGCWYVSVKSETEILPTKQVKSIVALDCGVRTFQTSFSTKESTAYGDNFASERLAPLMVEMDSLLSARDKLQGDKQYVNEWRKHYTKRIQKLRERQRNLVADLHRRVAFDLVSNYDVILLPTFETQSMSRKSNETKKRFLRRKTVRSMLNLAHYKFRQTLKWFAKKYGKTVVDVNEAYTSKTLWDGSILKNLGGAKSITFQGITIGRDFNGARNILIRYLTKALEVTKLKGAYPLTVADSTELNTSLCGFGGFK